jgi:hypothetical protein
LAGRNSGDAKKSEMVLRHLITPRRGRWISSIIETIGLLVGGVGAVAIVGYGTKWAALYSWGNHSPMPVSVAVISVLAGIDFILIGSTIAAIESVPETESDAPLSSPYRIDPIHLLALACIVGCLVLLAIGKGSDAVAGVLVLVVTFYFGKTSGTADVNRAIDTNREAVAAIAEHVKERTDETRAANVEALGDIKGLVNGATAESQRRLQAANDLLNEIDPAAIDAGRKRLAAKPGVPHG